MKILLVMVPLLPLLGVVMAARAGRGGARWGVAPVFAAAAASLALALTAIADPATMPLSLSLWQWGGNGMPTLSLWLDPLSLTMAVVVTAVAALVLLYAGTSMRSAEGYGRFFVYMNLFVAGMLLLVLAGDLVTLLLGWELVGICSFLLIGFHYHDTAAVRASRKALVVTRLGDVALIAAAGLLFVQFDSLTFDGIFAALGAHGLEASPKLFWLALLLVVAAVAKSAQLPLQVWLPDAMVGPTPVSALLHAATMVTAGVYLLLRFHAVLLIETGIADLVAVVGVLTVLGGGMAATAQWDIKRLLAYSTVSQIGYMFLAVGVGAWTAAVFHFAAHALFKALLFLAAGVLIARHDDEHDIRRLTLAGSPSVAAALWVGGAALAAVPLVSVGFFSKEWLLTEVRFATSGGEALWFGALAGVVFTAVYVARLLLYLARNGSAPREGVTPWPVALPLWVLVVATLVAGWVQTPEYLGGVHLFARGFETLFPGAAVTAVGAEAELALAAASLGAVVAGIALAWTGYRGWWRGSSALRAWQSLWERGGGFDGVYGALLVRPFTAVVRAFAADPLRRPGELVTVAAVALARGLRRTQTGQLRYYLAAVSAGAVVLVGVSVWS